MAYIHGLQAARDRLARAQQSLREAQASEARAMQLNRLADEIEAQVSEIRLRLVKQPKRRPVASENVYGGREGLLAAVAEMEEYSARKRARKESA